MSASSVTYREGVISPSGGELDEIFLDLLAIAATPVAGAPTRDDSGGGSSGGGGGGVFGTRAFPLPTPSAGCCNWCGNYKILNERSNCRIRSEHSGDQWTKISIKIVVKIFIRYT